jgi:integrase
MSLKLVAPRKGKSPNWTIRGTYLGVYVDRSSGTHRKPVARAVLRDLTERIERREYPEKAATPDAPTFLTASIAYMRAGRSRENLDRLISHFGETPLAEIDQALIDAAAIELYPNATPATRNRKVYTPASAVMRHAGVEIKLRRPKGAKGRQRTDFMTPADAEGVIAAAAAREPRFALLLKFLLYTGVRIGEALKLRWENLDLASRLAYIATSKNDDPRTVLLRPDLVSELADAQQETGPVFPFARGGGLKDRLVRARTEACGLSMPRRQKNAPAATRRALACRLSWVTFHTFRHTWATWMRREGGLDEIGLVATGNWRDPRSARRYAHTVARDEWSKVDLLPSVTRGKSAESGSHSQ